MDQKPNIDALSSRSDSPSSEHSSEGAPTMVTPTTTTSILTTLHRDRTANSTSNQNSPHKRRQHHLRESTSPPSLTPTVIPLSPTTQQNHLRHRTSLMDASSQHQHDDVEHSIPANLIQDSSVKR